MKHYCEGCNERDLEIVELKTKLHDLKIVHSGSKDAIKELRRQIKQEVMSFNKLVSIHKKEKEEIEKYIRKLSVDDRYCNVTLIAIQCFLNRKQKHTSPKDKE